MVCFVLAHHLMGANDVCVNLNFHFTALSGLNIKELLFELLFSSIFLRSLFIADVILLICMLMLYRV